MNEKYANKKIIDLYNIGVNSDFLDPKTQMEIMNKDIVFFGGYDDAARKILVANNEDELCCIKLLCKIELDHSSILGSVMALGVNRNKIGDIIVDNKEGYIISKYKMANYIKDHLFKVGRSEVKVEICSIKDLKYEKKVKAVKAINVSSMRLDSIVSGGFNISRTKALEQIKGQKIILNWNIVDKNTYICKDNDVISIRGMGRITIINIKNTTKKNRLNVNIIREN